MYFQRVSRLGSVIARHSSSGRQPNCGVEQRAPPIFGRAAITLGIGPHSSLKVVGSTGLDIEIIYGSPLQLLPVLKSLQTRRLILSLRI